jgi:hypothetical protein
MRSERVRAWDQISATTRLSASQLRAKSRASVEAT